MKCSAMRCAPCFGVPLVAPLDPAFDLRVFVGGVVVDDHVQGQAFGCLAVDLFEEGEPFGAGVALCGYGG